MFQEANGHLPAFGHTAKDAEKSLQPVDIDSLKKLRDFNPVLFIGLFSTVMKTSLSHRSQFRFDSPQKSGPGSNRSHDYSKERLSKIFRMRYPSATYWRSRNIRANDRTDLEIQDR